MRTGLRPHRARALPSLSPLKPLPAQEIKTSVSEPSEAPSFTFRKRRVGTDADARVAAILGRIRRHQHYPPLARESGAEGAATVSFRVLPDGRLRNLRIKKTSGNAHLDGASLEAVRKAAPLPWLDKTLVLTIRYTLTRTAD